MKLFNRYFIAYFMGLCASLFALGTAAAHPMGNFSINHYSAIRVEPSKVEILYVIDMAEIPTFQELRIDSIPPRPDDPDTQRYVARTATAFQSRLRLTIDGSPIILREISHQVIFPPGAGGLPTMKIAVALEAKTTPESRITRSGSNAAPRLLEYHDA